MEHQVALALWAVNDASVIGSVGGFGPGARSTAEVIPARESSCRSIGCFGHYRPELRCQCNDKCGHFRNCCEDFARACELELPPEREAETSTPSTTLAATTTTRTPAPTPAPTPERTTTTLPAKAVDGLAKSSHLNDLAQGLKAAAQAAKVPDAAPAPAAAPAATADKGHAGPTSATGSKRAFGPDEVPRCETAEACLQIVDLFLDGQPRSFGLLQARGDQKLGGGTCGAKCQLPECLLEKCGHNTYDNALAAIYYSKRGHLHKAKEILDAFRDMLYPEDLTRLRPRTPEALYVGNLSRQALTLLASSYASGQRPIPGNYESPYVTDGHVDSGVNAWAAMAFAHYAAAAKAPCYANIAREILEAISKAGTCQDSLQGFLGRLPPHRDNFRSTERNVAVFAAAQLLGLHQQRDQAAHFVRHMHGAIASADGTSAYATRTGSSVRCDVSMVKHDPLSAGTNFGTLLADADPNEAHMTSFLKFALQSPGPARDAGAKDEDHGLWVHDRDIVWMSGSGATPTLYGFRYTNHGHGVQWEVTASAVMAMLHYKTRYGDEEFNLQQYIDRARDSLGKLLGMYKGVPASVLGGNHAAWEDNSQNQTEFPGGSDTGLGEPELRYLTVASTAWTGLLYLYQPRAGGPLDEEANPYAVPKSGVPKDKETCWKAPHT